MRPFAATLILLHAIALTASAQSTQPITIKITANPITTSPISPLQYGQFIEYLCDLVPSMWSEKLYDNSFEGLRPYKFAFIRETDYREKPWYPTGAVNRLDLTLDRETKISGDASQRIAITGDTPATAGIAQDGVFVSPDQPLIFSCYLKNAGAAQKAHIRIRANDKTLAQTECLPTHDWKKFTVHLTPAARADDATITLDFRGPGTLWLDNISLMPQDTIGGWRPDVVRAVRQLKCGIIRFGGSALDDPNLGDFDWRSTIGAPDRRRPFYAWGGLQNPAAGIEEFVQFCQAVNAEPLICVRFNKRSPKDAADEIEYFNGSDQTPMGRERAKNGHADPYRVKYWQVGNELASPEYQAQLADFCRAMKKVDPTIQLLSSFPSRAILKNAGEHLDFVAPHHYTRDLPAMERDLLNIAQMIRENAPADRADKIKIAVTEWNVTAGDWGPNRATLWTLDNALACARYQNLLHRHADLVTIANRSNLTNSFCSGIIQTDRRGRLYKTPTYYAQQLYATLAGTTPLKIESPPDTKLDCSATRSPDGHTLTLFIVNPTASEIPTRIDATALGDLSGAILTHTLADRDRAHEPDAANTFEDPARILPIPAAINNDSDNPFDYRFPPYSLTVLDISLLAP